MGQHVRGRGHAGGTVRVKRASRMAMSGMSSSSLSGILISLVLSVMTTNKDVTSEPVPLVVGMAARNGLGRSGHGLVGEEHDGLGRVDGRSAAQGNDRVGLVPQEMAGPGGHGLRTDRAPRRRKRGI